MNIIEVFQGHDIAIRPDGYWNGSALCNTEGKQIEAFLGENSVKRYLEALSEDLGIPIINVVKSDYQGNPNSLIHCIDQGEGQRWEIWTHEEVALKLTGWLNPKLEIWFHRTIKKLLKEGQVKLENEVNGLKTALSQSQEQLEEVSNQLTLADYRNDQLRYERDELSSLANWRKENSFTGRDAG
jgi:hypothetical protein